MTVKRLYKYRIKVALSIIKTVYTMVSLEHTFYFGGGGLILCARHDIAKAHLLSHTHNKECRANDIILL